MKKTFIIFLVILSQNISFAQWFEKPTPDPAFNLFSFSFPSANTGFAVGYGNRMIKSTNGGETWFNISFLNTTANDLTSVWFKDENTGWIGSTSDTLFYTTNSGTSWSPQKSFVSDVTKIFFVNSNTGWVLSQPNLFMTTNAGMNWTLVNSTMGFYFIFLNENTGWMTKYIGGGSTIYKTTNGGASYSPQYTTSDFRVIYCMDFVDENTGWAAGYREHILKTTNGGTNWTQQRDLDNSTGLFSMKFFDANTGWVIGGAGYSLYTLNGGTSWTQVALSAGNANIQFINPMTGWVIGSRVFKTTTGGFTFRNLQLTSLIEGLYDDNTNTMVTDNAKVYLRNNSTPYGIIDSAGAQLNSNGAATFNFLNAVNGVNYYIIVSQRNSLDTWSSTPQSFSSNNLSFDFTTASSKAFGNNLKEKGTRWTVYSGDINKDGSIDLDDLINTYNAALNFSSGNLVTDVNGDNFTDLTDIVIVHNNSVKFVSVIRP